MKRRRIVIKRYGVIYPAALCQRCGTKIYPAKALAGHQAHHETSDFIARDVMASLQRGFPQMTKGSYL